MGGGPRRPRHLLRAGGDALRSDGRPPRAPPADGPPGSRRTPHARQPGEALRDAAGDPHGATILRSAHRRGPRGARLLARRRRGAPRARHRLMAGILAAGVSIPRYRLPREIIAKEWGGHSAGGEKAVA